MVAYSYCDVCHMYKEHIQSMKNYNCIHAIKPLSVSDNASVLGVQNIPVLVGGSSDNASAIMSDLNGKRGQLQKVLSWCFAHRLEVAYKDAFVSPLFKGVNKCYFVCITLMKISRDPASIVDISYQQR